MSDDEEEFSRTDDLTPPYGVTLFTEPFDLSVISTELSDPQWNKFGARHWVGLWYHRHNWEKSARQLGRLYPVWKGANLDTFLLDRVFYWLIDIATEYQDSEAEAMVRVLVEGVDRPPPNPNPREDRNSPGAFPKRKPISKALRFRVLQRDGFACRYCGVRPPDAVLQCDHIRPVAASGATVMENLVAACAACNIGKADAYDERTALLNKVLWAKKRERE